MDETSRPQTAQSIEPISQGAGPPPPTARPVSRRRFGEPMTARQRPDSRMSSESTSSSQQQNRPMSRISRLQSATRPPSSSLRLGSAMRVPTASQNRPPSGITGGSLPLHASVGLFIYFKLHFFT
jgi:hypothetical protein